MRKSFSGLMAAALVLAGVASFSQARVDEELTIKAIMKEGYKGDASLSKKVGGGTATADEKKRFLVINEALAKGKPPKGEAASWETKTKALVEASQAAIDGKDNASDLLKAAGNCKACHEVHKGN